MATHSIILAGKSHGQRSLVVYSPWGHKELDTTEILSNNKQQQTSSCTAKLKGIDSH